MSRNNGDRPDEDHAEAELENEDDQDQDTESEDDMPDISVADIKALRDATGAGMMDAKKALTEAGGDADEARKILREKGLAKAAGRTDRDNAEGAVAIAKADGVAAIVHLKSETDFAAKSEEFLTVLDALVDDVLANGADAVSAHTAAIEELQITKKENIELGLVERVEAGDGNDIHTYLHQQDGRGTNGVIVVGNGIDADMLQQVGWHIAFAKPLGLSRDEIDPAVAETERETLMGLTRAEGKPEEMLEKIVDGKMARWFGEQVLLEQGLNGDKTSVRESLGGGTIVSFRQAYLGG
ncbi:MAG: translation elongation factor Ts [Acidimicrobiales bacterium]|nr:translation elongation factor Ts [Acidimicrobiales bacterium]